MIYLHASRPPRQTTGALCFERHAADDVYDVEEPKPAKATTTQAPEETRPQHDTLATKGLGVHGVNRKCSVRVDWMRQES